MQIRRFVLLLVVMAGTALSVFPQADIPASVPATIPAGAAGAVDAALSDPGLADAAAGLFGLGLDLGFVSLPDASGLLVGWNTLALTPDLALGDFGIGLDINLKYRFDGGADGQSFEVRSEDWIPDAEHSVLDLYLPLIKYVRYGTKGKPFYLSLGDMDRGTIGNGFLLGGYRNTVFKPAQRLFGISMDIDGSVFKFPYIGLETLVSNMAAFDILGTRFYVRPGAGSGIPLLEGTQIGVSFVTDTNPYYFDTDASDGVDKFTHPDTPVLMFGVDFKQPIVAADLATLSFYGDYALQNTRMGTQIGLGGRLFGFLDYLAYVRIHDKLFIPSYIDQSYDLMRESKLAIYLDTTTPAETVSGWLGSLGFTVLDGVIVFNATVSGPFNPDPAVLFQNPDLKASLSLKEGLIGGLGASAYYEKKNITSFESLIDPTYALIGANISYKIGPAVIKFTYDLRYDETLSGTEPWVITSKLETSIDLF